MQAMDNTARITARDLSGMVEHWIGCPPCGYLGSDYGSEIKALLQTPQASGLADGLIAKCRLDVPLLARAEPGTLNVYAYNETMDRKILVFDVRGELINIGEVGA